jgi:hypothetical protein
VVDQQTIGDQVIGQPTGGEGVPVVCAGVVDLAVKDAAAAEYLAARIPERGRFERRLGQRSDRLEPSASDVASGFETPRRRSKAPPILWRRKNGTDRIAARMACSSKLPEPGSM